MKKNEIATILKEMEKANNEKDYNKLGELTAKLSLLQTKPKKKIGIRQYEKEAQEYRDFKRCDLID